MRPFSALLACAVFIQGLALFLCDDLPSETGSTEEPFPKQKCESLLENCLCYDYEVIAGIMCNNLTNFSKFSRLLATNAIFSHPNTTYEITLNELDYLPARCMDGLIVYRLYLDDPTLSSIDKDAFQGVRRLRRFHVRRSSIKEVPEFHSINDSLRSINIDNSRLTALRGESLQNLPLVERLSLVNNSISYIDPNAFKGTDSVIILDLSYNHLTSIPPRILEPMKNLTKFVLTHNRIMQVDGLFNVTHPRFIYLDFNNISDIESVLVRNMFRVETVILASNPIQKLSTHSFNSKIPKARFLYLDHCLLREFNVSHFKHLSNLSTLDLSSNLIEDIQYQKIDFGAGSLELDLIGNKIRSFKAEMTYKVKRVYLNENKLQSLGRTLQFSQLTEVSVARNQIQYLSADDLRGVHGTANLELQGNQIKWMDQMTFLNLRNDLHYLDLSANHIVSLNGSVRYLSQLKLLNVSDNRIQTFANGDFIGLNELSELYLQRNHIVALSGQLQLIPRLQYLVVTQNRIKTLKSEQLPEKLKYIYLAGNPFKCDCRLLPFLLWLNTSSSPGTDISLCLPTEETKYNHFHDPCPKNCNCSCTEDEDDYFMTVNCSSQNMTVLPPFLTGSVMEVDNTSTVTFDFRRSLVFDLNTDSSFHISDRIRGIDLSNNSLESLHSAQFPADLLHLHLSKNQLRTLDEAMLHNMQKLRRITLSENPWECDCSAVPFKKWIVTKMEIIQDVNNTRCGVEENSESKLDGRALWTLTDLDLCPANIGMYISIAFGALSFLLLCLATKIVYTKFELNIKVYLYSHGITWVKARDLDYDKQYDAFISFSHKDETFVAREILAGIETRDPNIRLCVHYRDFKAGEFIHDNIINAVQNSKRTVLVLSKNFLESEWCLMEFRAAHVQALEDKVHRIIVIKVGDLPKDIDPAIKVYLDSTTYLTWGDKYFWKNLLYVLPTSSTPRSAYSTPTNVNFPAILSRSNSKLIQA